MSYSKSSYMQGWKAEYVVYCPQNFVNDVSQNTLSNFSGILYFSSCLCVTILVCQIIGLATPCGFKWDYTAIYQHDLLQSSNWSFADYILICTQ